MLTTQIIHQIRAGSGCPLVDRGAAAVRHARILAQLRHVCRSEVGLLFGKQSGHGIAGRLAGGITGLRIPGEVGKIVARSGAEQIDGPPVASRADLGIQQGLRSPLSARAHDPGSRVDLIGCQIAHPLLRDVAGAVSGVVAGHRRHGRGGCRRAGAKHRLDACQRLLEAADHRVRVVGAEIQPAAVDRGMPEIVDRPRVAVTGGIGVIKGRIGPHRPGLRCAVREARIGRRTGVVATSAQGIAADACEVPHRITLVGRAVIQGAGDAECQSEGRHVLVSGTIPLGSGTFLDAYIVGQLRSQVGDVVVLRHVSQRIAAASGNARIDDAWPFAAGTRRWGVADARTSGVRHGTEGGRQCRGIGVADAVDIDVSRIIAGRRSADFEAGDSSVKEGRGHLRLNALLQLVAR
ncbi:MAG: hypothetical protein AW09_003854 [Candidatus Accumulibacter phosphatis]|uniref:Uncharacterized protein n=1 Tax=Candidatus Accumulibacter phosphatis TaxID=327160 RepID=A0A080M1G6_9PROT|nr:MAG: hypothetical protein AW09_003854 [Candidatus Accumulibacter phosphatis]